MIYSVRLNVSKTVMSEGNADVAADTLSKAGFDVSMTTVDVSSRASVQALVDMAMVR
jgi:hypothetical protein